MSGWLRGVEGFDTEHHGGGRDGGEEMGGRDGVEG